MKKIYRLNPLKEAEDSTNFSINAKKQVPLDFAVWNKFIILRSLAFSFFFSILLKRNFVSIPSADFFQPELA